MEGPISFWGYKEQEWNLMLLEHDDDDDDDDDNRRNKIKFSPVRFKGWGFLHFSVIAAERDTNIDSGLIFLC